MKKIKTIISKEWAEVFKNRMVLFTVAFLPLILTAIPLIMLVVMNQFGGDMGMEELSSSGGLDILGVRCAGLNESDCTILYMLDLFTMMFMILPVAIPVTIAAYSIVGEKATHSLEPLLATPITTTELLVGKAVAAVVPAILATWLAFLIYLIGAWFFVSDELFMLLIDPMWAIAIIVVGPLLALLSVCFAIMVSSRVTDPRVAEQLSTLVILPLIMIIVGQSVGIVILSRELVLLIAIGLIVLDAILLFLSVKLFQRETILTRWK